MGDTITGKDYEVTLATLRWVRCRSCDKEHLVSDWPGRPGRVLEFATLTEVDGGEETPFGLVKFHGPASLCEVQFQLLAPEVDQAKCMIRAMVAGGAVTAFPTSQFMQDQIVSGPHEGGTQ